MCRSKQEPFFSSIPYINELVMPLLLEPIGSPHLIDGSPSCRNSQYTDDQRLKLEYNRPPIIFSFRSDVEGRSPNSTGSTMAVAAGREKP
ncbi:hypothetical protein HB774_02220 [Rhizobium leguminosarum bv. viciae]|nr:hypothetical protein HB774_02220 [Rhizobium leguminosarum bv. viciae]